jgi:hypothetical protein
MRAREYPEDARNTRAVEGLEELANTVRGMSEDDPVLVDLTRLCHISGLDVYVLMPTNPAEAGINPSQFRFHDPYESG